MAARAAPTLPTGKIVAVCSSRDKGSKKEPVSHSFLREGYGLIGDAHAGSPRQVSLLTMESIRRVYGEGVKIAPGDSAENILTEGVDLARLATGTRIHIGQHVILEITQIGKEHDQPEFRPLVHEGVFARVIQGGMVKPGDNFDVRA